MARRRKGRPVTGVLLIDKPQGWSSNGLLQKVRWLFQAQKAGHTGALDPAATGLLPVCFGEATKFTQFLLNADKRYITTGILGVETDTLDAEGEVTARHDVPEIDAEALGHVLSEHFTGDIEQIPPMYSALKRDGKKLYELAREGKSVELAARPVHIFHNRLLRLDGAEFDLDVACTKGTYIRTLVADVGTRLGCGAHVKSLRRLQHGAFRLEQAVTLETLETLREQEGPEALDRYLFSLDDLLSDLPVIQLNELHSRLFSHGNDVQTEAGPGQARVYDVESRFLGVGRVTEHSRLQPVRLVARDSA